MKLRLLVAACAALAFGVPACSSTHEPGPGDENDLTSLTARSRELKFEGLVYVNPNVGEDFIIKTILAQTETAFGPLLSSNISVNTRELKSIDPNTIIRRSVRVIDPANPSAAGMPMTEIRYTYTDAAIVDLKLAARSAMPILLMNPNYATQTERVLKECTPNDKESRVFSEDLWFIVEPALKTCRDAVKVESDAIAADRKKLLDPKTEVTQSEIKRLYIPATASLGADKTNRGASFPEYDRLFSGGVEKDKLVVSLVVGLIDDETPVIRKDSGYFEWLSTLNEVFTANPGFALTKVRGVDGGDARQDVSKYTLKNGKEIAGVGFPDFIRWEVEGAGFPKGLDPAERAELRTLVGARISLKWLSFDRPITVAIGDGPAKDFTVEILTFFGASQSTDVFRFALKNSDVFLYNGHTLIGGGPLDPKNFTKDSFPSSYQMLFIDSCVSYNYYESDYIPLKQGGTKNLDLITNGIEAPADDSGAAQGKFISALLTGKASYRQLLTAVSATDSLRVVDGELDNTFSADKTPITLKAK